MTIFDGFKSMNIDEFAEWMNKYWDSDNAPWWGWWDEKYCQNCEPEIGHYENCDRDMEFGWCELHGKCRFFQEMDDIPDSKQTIKMWLERDNEDN